MSDDDLEQRLAALRPADLPVDLQQRLAGPPVARGKIRWLFGAVPLAAAACWFLVLSLERPATAPAPPVSSGPQPADYRVFLPVEQSSTLVSVENLTVVDEHSTTPIQILRATWVDDTTYAGDDGRSTFQRRETRAEIIPVALETF